MLCDSLCDFVAHSDAKTTQVKLDRHPRAAAIAWAEHEREAFEQPPDPVVVPLGKTLGSW
jgi:hypothetical protein